MANKNMKRCTISLVTRKIQIKTTDTQRMATIKMTDVKIYLLGELFVENSEPQYSTGGTVKQCSHFGKQFVSYSND